MERRTELTYRVMDYSILYFTAATLLAMYLYPDYDVEGQFLSALGVGPTGVLFNTGVAALGVATILYYVEMTRSFTRWQSLIGVRRAQLGRTASRSAVLTGLLLLGVAIFISDGATSDTHDAFAISYFLLLIPIYAVLPLALPVREQPHRALIWSSSLLVSFATAVAFFVPGVNQYVFQKIVVGLQLIFFLSCTRWMRIVASSKR